MSQRTIGLAFGAALVLAAALVAAGCMNTGTNSTGAVPTGAGSGYGDVSGGTPVGASR